MQNWVRFLFEENWELLFTPEAWFACIKRTLALWGPSPQMPDPSLHPSVGGAAPLLDYEK